MRLLLTRPREDAEETADALTALGHEVLLEPLLTIVPTEGAKPDLGGVQAILVTSRNGLRALVEASGRRDLPLYAVGPSSAEAARRAGFTQVVSADGDAAALTRLVIGALDPAAGALLHPAGRETAGDLSERLVEAGFELRRVVLYEARGAERLSHAAHTALAQGELDGVMFFSPRTAATFASLVARAGLGEACAGLVAFCISPAAATAIRTLAWRDVRVAAAPNQDALLDAMAAPAGFPEQRNGEMADDAKTGKTADETPPEQSAQGQDEREERELAASEKEDEERTASETEDEAQPADEEPSGAETSHAADAEPAPETSPESDEPVERIIARFGGLRPMASKLGLASSTVQGWRSRRHIPPSRHAEILEAARRHGIALEESELGEPARPAGPTPAPTAQTSPQPAEAPAPEEEEATAPAKAAASALPSSSARAPAAKPEPARSGGGIGAVFGGLVVGVLAVAIGAGVAVYTREHWLPLVGMPSDDGLTALEARVAELEDQPVVVDRSGAIATLEESLEELGDRLDAVEGGTGREVEEELATLAEDVGQLSESLTALEGILAELEESAISAAAPGLAASLAELGDRVGALEQRQEEPAGNVQLQEDLDGRLGELEARLAELQDQAAATAALGEGLAGLEQRLDQAMQLEAAASERDQRLGAAEARLAEATEQLGGRLSAVESGLQQAQALEGSTQSLQERLDAAESTLVEVAEAAERALASRDGQLALVLVLNRLRDALQSSEPYGEALAGVQWVAARDEGLAKALAPLEAHAATGVQTREELRRDFPASEFIAAAQGGSGGSWTDGALRELSQIVVIRPLGESEGEYAGAVVGRAEARLAAGDLPGALAELERLRDGEGNAVQLDELSEAPAQWLANARARLEAERALDGVAQQVVARLAPQQG